MDKDKMKQGVIMDHVGTELTTNIIRGKKTDMAKECPFKCSKSHCGRAFSEQTALVVHDRFVHEGIKECEQCSKTFSKFQRLLRHVSQVHNRERKFECGVCSKSLVTKDTLQRHMLTHLENRERRWKCEVCSKTFFEEKYLLQHIRSHTGGKPCSCKICGKGFSYPVFLKNHAVVHTRERPYSCSICSKTFASASGLRGHKNLHTGERRHGCNLCDKRFGRKYHLERHMWCHTGEKPYNCSYCSKSFQLSETLRHHVSVTHLRIKKLECIFCLKMFPKKVHLFQHLWVHTKEAPYFCKVCPAEFKSHPKVAKHTRLHSAPKSEPASRNILCSKEYGSVGARLLHKRSHCGRRRSCRNHCSGGHEELKSHEKATAVEPITYYYSCVFCSRGFSRYGHMCNTRVLQRWRVQCGI